MKIKSREIEEIRSILLDLGYEYECRALNENIFIKKENIQEHFKVFGSWLDITFKSKDSKIEIWNDGTIFKKVQRYLDEFRKIPTGWQYEELSKEEEKALNGDKAQASLF